MKKNERVKALYDQYSKLLFFLKKEGCLINTIRPEFLLNCQDYNIFIKLE